MEELKRLINALNNRHDKKMTLVELASIINIEGVTVSALQKIKLGSTKSYDLDRGLAIISALRPYLDAKSYY